MLAPCFSVSSKLVKFTYKSHLEVLLVELRAVPASQLATSPGYNRDEMSFGGPLMPVRFKHEAP